MKGFKFEFTTDDGYRFSTDGASFDDLIEELNLALRNSGDIEEEEELVLTNFEQRKILSHAGV